MDVVIDGEKKMPAIIFSLVTTEGPIAGETLLKVMISREEFGETISWLRGELKKLEWNKQQGHIE